MRIAQGYIKLIISLDTQDTDISLCIYVHMYIYMMWMKHVNA